MARIGGRQKGTPNKITTAFKDAVRIVYDDIGGHRAFAAWARENPTEFYRIASRLIPAEFVARQELAVLSLTFGDAGHGAAPNGGEVPSVEGGGIQAPGAIGINSQSATASARGQRK